MPTNKKQILNNFPGVQELSDQRAAVIQGGFDLKIYRHGDQKDKMASFNFGIKQLASNSNNQTSSVYIRAGRWRFYNFSGWNSLGGFIERGPGKHNLPSWLNDKISSIQRF